MSINTAVASTPEDRAYLETRYRHISAAMFARKFAVGEYMVIRREEQPFGWLRWGYFWDSIPFMNMLHIEDAYRQRGYGRQLVLAWEAAMHANGHDQVMTSTQADETAQHFYRKLGYKDQGALLLPGEPLEIILLKRI
ncbi:MAG: GNAT family N-acetyltransferase [Anaerolineae bacterium]